MVDICQNTKPRCRRICAPVMVEAKKQQETYRKAAKKQQKAMKKYEKAQRKAAKKEAKKTNRHA